VPAWGAVLISKCLGMIWNVTPEGIRSPMVPASVYLGRGTSRLRDCVVMLVLGRQMARSGDPRGGLYYMVPLSD